MQITPRGSDLFGVVLAEWPAAQAGAGAAPVRPFLPEVTAASLLGMAKAADFIKTLALADVISAGHPLATAGMDALKAAGLLPPTGMHGAGCIWMAGWHRFKQYMGGCTAVLGKAAWMGIKAALHLVAMVRVI